jgi:hypothetical protein
MLSLCAAALAVPAHEEAATLGHGVTLKHNRQKDDFFCFEDNEFFATSSGGHDHEGGHLFVYSVVPKTPDVGTEIELSTFPGQKWIVEKDRSDVPTEQLRRNELKSFSVVTSDGAPHGLPYSRQNTATCFGDNDIFLTGPGGFEHSHGHLYVVTRGRRPEVGTKVELSTFPDITWEVVDNPEGWREEVLLTGGPRQVGSTGFSVKRADGKAHGIPVDRQSNGNNREIIGKWSCVDAARPSKPIGTWACNGATPQITVHGDPIFRFGKKHNATRLWLPTGLQTSLLTWEASGGKTLSLLGRTFHPRHNNSYGVRKSNEVLCHAFLHLITAHQTPPLRACLAVV